ncbi:hypothetical protein OG233_06800 [Streptomyces sp. NBC_01218]|uniref:hypothetical protein n=1 Tax=Streptomyces sp. NBC_01218 TaxID=2903780 RepID=UPI002E12BA2A|nr:hypothetical protein OG233_06800 [Streptomyces sp. NBC_01218]
MTTEEFVMLFGSSGHVRASLDWSRVTELRLRVQHSFHTSADRLGRMATLWYTRPDGTPAEYTHPQATPLTARQAAAADMRTLPQRQNTLGALTQQAATCREPVQLILPAYRLPDGTDLILDGTHRAVAALRARARVTVFLYVLLGPADPTILPDLAYHHRR